VTEAGWLLVIILHGFGGSPIYPNLPVQLGPFSSEARCGDAAGQVMALPGSAKDKSLVKGEWKCIRQ